MIQRKVLRLCLWIVLMGGLAFLLPNADTQPVFARAPATRTDNGTCISCHEDLYFLHDTGNWYCIRESPMRCVDCHGGDPTSIKKEEAHAHRTAHPIINDDVSKCQECHPAECRERVAEFNQVAGISEVLVAVPYQPASIPAVETAPTEINPAWIAAMEIITLVLITGLVAATYFVHKKHHR
ncbi:MAG: hypothetical protein AB1649_31545 [Chloroflexota bacterium]